MGHHRRAEGSRARCRAGRSSPSRRSCPRCDRGRARSCCPPGRWLRRAGARRRPSVLCAGLLVQGQRLLPGLGRDQPGPGAFRGWLDEHVYGPARPAAARARAGMTQRGRRLHVRRDDDGDRGPGAPGRDDLLRRHRAAQRGRQPRPRHPRRRPGADLRVGHHRRQARLAAAVHRRRRAGRDRRRRGQRPGDLQLLAAAGPDRRGLPGAAQIDRFGNINTTVVGPDYDAPGGPAAGRGRRAGDRGVLPPGHRHRPAEHAGVRGPGGLRHLGRASATGRAAGSASG